MEELAVEVNMWVYDSNIELWTVTNEITEEYLRNEDGSLSDFTLKYLNPPTNFGNMNDNNNIFDDGCVLALEFMYYGYHSSRSSCRLNNLSMNPKNIQLSNGGKMVVSNSGKLPLPELDLSTKYSPQVLANYPQEFTLYLASNKPVKAHIVVLADGRDRSHLTASEIMSGVNDSVYSRNIFINNKINDSLNFEITLNITDLPASWSYENDEYSPKVMKYHVNILLEDSYKQFSVSDNLIWNNWLEPVVQLKMVYITLNILLQLQISLPKRF